LIKFKEELEEHFQVRIGEEALKSSITLFNRMRTLLKEIYRLRSSNPAILSAEEVTKIVMLGMILPKEDYVSLLEALLEELRAVALSAPIEIHPRLMLMGSELDNPQYFRIIEESGARIVMDDLCCGSRYFWDLVPEEGDPLEALAVRYLNKLPCPRMHPARQRLERLLSLAQEFQVEGVVYQSIKFCDLHAGIFPIIKREFNGIDIPVLRLEREYLLPSSGQTRTRIQAFIELLQEG